MTQHDRTILRNLATKVADIAHLPIQAQRIARWKRHNSLKSTEPMLLVFPEGAWRELLPEGTCRCEDPALHGMKTRTAPTSARRWKPLAAA